MSCSSICLSIQAHKPNFNSDPSISLINPSKPDIGSISIKIIDKFSSKIKTKSTLWNNTCKVLFNKICNLVLFCWFNKISNENKHHFFQFGIKDYHASITKPILTTALNFTKTISTINDTKIKPILQARKFILFHYNAFWIKKNTKDPFGVSMGSKDSPEISNMMGLCI